MHSFGRDRLDMAFNAQQHRPAFRGVTVRNTFLEFQDPSLDEFSNDNAFNRQASEPAKPFSRQISEPAKTLGSRQVSEQTTVASGGAYEDSRGRELMSEEGTVDMDDRFHQIASYLNTPLKDNGQNLFMAHEGFDPTYTEVPADALQAAFRAVTLAAQAQAQAQFQHQLQKLQQPAAPEAPLMVPQHNAVARYCPNCGAKVEPTHRFCPYCCYQLNQPQTTSQTPQRGAVPVSLSASMASTGNMHESELRQGSLRRVGLVPRQACAPDVLSQLGRLRYDEASLLDVELAKAMVATAMSRGQC
jgi:hypothetical protein